MKNKRGFEVSFGWLFAIIVGAVILFLAIYGVAKLIQSDSGIQSTKASENFGVLLEPLETSFESSVYTSLTTSAETKLRTICKEDGTFGNQIISISEKSFGEWRKPITDVGFPNKYLFSDDAQGKKFYLFSKPFEFPFKIADLIYIIPSNRKYCFKDIEDYAKSVSDDLKRLNTDNLLLDDCDDGENIVVCFSGESCDINVNYILGVVEKDGESYDFYGDALMFAAIFSDKDNYDCQVKRLMKRTFELAKIYHNKANFVANKGCHSRLTPDLFQLQTNVENAEKITSPMKTLVENLERANTGGVECNIW